MALSRSTLAGRLAARPTLRPSTGQRIGAQLRFPRNGATAVEFALVGGLVFFLIFGLFVGAMGIFRYQEVAHLAREGARYAATHGGQYHLDGIDTQTSVSTTSVSTTSVSTTSVSTTGVSATGVSATGVSTTGVSATGVSATGVSAISSSSDLRSYLLPKAILLDPSRLQITASWSPPTGATPVNMPSYVNTDPNLIPPGQQVIQNYVTVTVTYQWLPELYLVGPITLTSTSTMPMSY